MDTFFSLVLTALDHPAWIHGMLFLILFFSGIGLGALPEEVALLLGGYLAHLEFIRFPAALVVLTLGVLSADSFGYWTGYFLGDWIERRIVARWGFAARMTEKVKKMFVRYGERMVIFSRPFFAVRVAVPMFAGHTKMPFRRFFLYDALVSVPWTIAAVSAGFYLSASLDVFAEARAIKHYFFLGMVLCAVGYAALRLIKAAFGQVQ